MINAYQFASKVHQFQVAVEVCDTQTDVKECIKCGINLVMTMMTSCVLSS